MVKGERKIRSNVLYIFGLYCSTIWVCDTCSREREREGYGREKLIPSGLSVEGGRGGEEIPGWHAVVRQVQDDGSKMMCGK